MRAALSGKAMDLDPRGLGQSSFVNFCKASSGANAMTKCTVLTWARYTLYRAVMMVVTQYYRPNFDDQELEARRSLTWALNQLDSIDGSSAFRLLGSN